MIYSPAPSRGNWLQHFSKRSRQISLYVELNYASLGFCNVSWASRIIKCFTFNLYLLQVEVGSECRRTFPLSFRELPDPLKALCQHQINDEWTGRKVVLSRRDTREPQNIKASRDLRDGPGQRFSNLNLHQDLIKNLLIHRLHPRVSVWGLRWGLKDLHFYQLPDDTILETTLWGPLIYCNFFILQMWNQNQRV